MADIKNISIVEIVDPENPMRSEIDRDAVFELAGSIKQQGLINPITVRPRAGKFEVVAGHRRFTACKLAGLTEIACVIRDLDDNAAWSMMAHENLERQDIDPVDEAIFLGRLIGEDASKIKQVADSLNRSVVWVESRLAILEYPDYFLPAIKTGEIKLGVACRLAEIENDYWRKHFFESAIRNGMSVPQADYALAQWRMGILTSPDAVDLNAAPTNAGERVLAHTTCAACKGEAIEPNMQLLWVHITCPSEKISE